MTYCLNPQCQQPENPDNLQFCQSCGAPLWLRNRYRPIKLLGEGGFGRTFFAEDRDRLDAPCAIKQFLPLPQVRQDPQQLETATKLFTQEAKRLLELGDRPEIPTLYADFEQDGRLYLIQQFIDGNSLFEELEANGPFSSEDIEDILFDLLPVLEYIHEAQVIHRDIKPENIMRRREDGKLVLIDFGVAKHLTGTVLVKTGTKIGTEGYAPIEQLRGGKAYPASDLYSLGVTCVHLLTDKTPDELYDPTNGRWLWREQLEKQGRTIGDRLEKVLNKMLQEWVGDRYPSAREAIADLAWNSGTIAPAAARPGAISRSRLPQGWKCIHTLEAHQNYVIAVAIASDNQTLVSCSYDKTIKVWHLDTGHLLGTLTGHRGWVSCLSIGPDGRSLVSGSLDNRLLYWDLGTGTLKETLTGHSSYPIALTSSADGQYLVAGCFDGTIAVWDWSTRSSLAQLGGHAGSVESVAISPDSRTLASGGGYEDRTIKLWELSGAELKQSLAGHRASVRALAFTPDGTRLASGSEDRTLKIWDLATGKILHDLSHPSGWIQAIAISPDGRAIATGSRDSTIKIWRLDTCELLYTLKWHSEPVTSLTFSPDGLRLASASWDKTVKIWQAIL
ncbi:MAG: hypothetical protein D6680_19705 [Cyanobacteria bacterium J007]|nr:MAG: hypothetical protein D6680_19705 [Cyanobacteria bacterium J007]